MKNRPIILSLLCLALLLAGAWGAHRVAFDWASLRVQLRAVVWRHVAVGVSCIYLTFWLRAVRWAILIGPGRKVSSNSLIAPQFIGFTAVALFGRLADLARPYLIARRTGLPVASQIAVYSIERIFDLAAAAILISVTLAFAPRDLPHHEIMSHAGLLFLAGTVFLGVFALVIRFSGDLLARLAAASLRPVSPRIAELAAARILDFRSGLYTLSSLREFVFALTLSLAMWLAVAFAYLQSVRAMAATPELVALSFTQIMLLMATSMGGSLLQLPILGWFTQIALMAAAVHKFFNVPLEAATAYGALLLFINSLSIIPVGLVASRLAGTTLREAAEADVHAAAAVPVTPPPGTL